MCTDVWIDVWLDMCMDMSTDMCVDMCMWIDICMGMWLDMGVDKGTEWCFSQSGYGDWVGECSAKWLQGGGVFLGHGTHTHGCRRCHRSKNEAAAADDLPVHPVGDRVGVGDVGAGVGGAREKRSLSVCTCVYAHVYTHVYIHV